ncbi:hypothetical protein [Streptomyces sp. NPDC001851]|uniref:DinB/UmuC family translesion DNA polymerase n=1 Tax=Streptomyces sp. NPDC001851 TaxID=3154529 RepID=UPI00331941A2
MPHKYPGRAHSAPTNEWQNPRPRHRIVDPTPAPASLSTEHRFARDELDPAAHRRVLLALADDLGARLRASGQIATGVTCTIRYADLSTTRRSRTLPRSHPAHRPPGPRGVRGVRLSRPPQRPGPRHHAAPTPLDPPTRPLGSSPSTAVTTSRWRSKPWPITPLSARQWEQGGRPGAAHARRGT